MAELTKDDIKDAVREAMAEKFEMALGIDCRSPDERIETRKDMEHLRKLRIDDIEHGEEDAEDRKFLRAMHNGARSAGQRAFWWAVTIIGGSALAVLWPEITRRIGK